MQKIRMYHVDAFTEKLFSGNPAAVCILDSWLDDNLMQSIAIENNLPETAFIVPDGRDFAIRWFSPAVEIDLCGHATLASAYVIFNELDHHDTLIRFHSPKSGLLMAKQTDDLISLDFPSDTLTISSEEEINFLENCLGIRPLELHKGKSDYLALVDNESILQEIKPDFKRIALLDARGVIVTARGEKADFVSRFFAPRVGIDEDPVTGSAHTSLLPFWSERLNKSLLTAYQLSKRGGQLVCEYKGNRCSIGGRARLYLSGEINCD